MLETWWEEEFHMNKQPQNHTNYNDLVKQRLYQADLCKGKWKLQQLKILGHQLQQQEVKSFINLLV